MRVVFRNVPVDTKPGGRPFSDAEIVARGVDQAGTSFEVLVFLNNPGADESTPLDEKHGYAGSFHVYGFGLNRSEGAAPRQLPTDYSVPASSAVRAAIEQSRLVTVTLVPRYYNSGAAPDGVFHLDGVSIITR